MVDKKEEKHRALSNLRSEVFPLVSGCSITDLLINCYELGSVD